MHCDIGNIGGLVADPLHVGDHFQRRGDFAQIACHGLLLKQEAHTEIFNIAFLLIDFPLGLMHLVKLYFVVIVPIKQSVYGDRNRLLAERSHRDQLCVQFFELFVEAVSHYPNLPVI